MGCLISGLGGWLGLGGELGAPVPQNLRITPQLPQSLFERQGLPGPEKLPGSLRKGIPRTKSVGMAGLGAARGQKEWGWGWGGCWAGGPFLSQPFNWSFQFLSENCLS